MADTRNAMGMPEPEREQPVAPYQPGKPVGERQDGAGAGPKRPDFTEAVPAGTIAARRSGPVAPQAEGEEPAHDERGEPAPLTGGAARGSGSAAGGGGTGTAEDFDDDSASGGGRQEGDARQNGGH